MNDVGKLIIAAVLALACMSSTVFAAPSAKYNRYESEPYLFSFAYPADWETIEGVAGSVVTLLASGDNSVGGLRAEASMMVRDIPDHLDTDLDEYAEMSQVQLERKVADFQIIAVDAITLGGQPAKMLTYTGKEGVFKLRWTQVYAMYRHRAYVLTFSVEDAKCIKTAPVIKEMLKSFRFLD